MSIAFNSIKNTSLLFSFLFLGVFSIHAQHEAKTDIHTFGVWTKEDKTAYIFADISNVRQAPDVKAELTGKIPIGTEVQILEITSVEFTQNGIASPWIKIKTSALTGYVWGGTLTNQVLKMANGEIAVWGLTEIKKTEDNGEFKASVRIAFRGVVKTKQDFTVEEYASRPEEGYLTLFPAPQLLGVKNLIVFSTPSEACGVFESEHYLLYTGNELLFMETGYSMGDGGVLHTSKAFVFPYESNNDIYMSYHYTPEKNHVLCVYNEGEYDDDCIWSETYKVIDYLWQDNKLVKFCNQ